MPTYAAFCKLRLRATLVFSRISEKVYRQRMADVTLNSKLRGRHPPSPHEASTRTGKALSFFSGQHSSGCTQRDFGFQVEVCDWLGHMFMPKAVSIWWTPYGIMVIGSSDIPITPLLQGWGRPFSAYSISRGP